MSRKETKTNHHAEYTKSHNAPGNRTAKGAPMQATLFTRSGENKQRGMSSQELVPQDYLFQHLLKNEK